MTEPHWIWAQSRGKIRTVVNGKLVEICRFYPKHTRDASSEDEVLPLPSFKVWLLTAMIDGPIYFMWVERGLDDDVIGAGAPNSRQATQSVEGDPEQFARAAQYDEVHAQFLHEVSHEDCMRLLL